jgi:sugar/nucleoside kinase (ribokinase family)
MAHAKQWHGLSARSEGVVQQDTCRKINRSKMSAASTAWKAMPQLHPESPMPSREQICRSTSQKVREIAPSLARTRALIGLDGFVDEIIAVVDKRIDNERYEAIRTIGEFGEKICKAAGESCNYELVVKQMKLGGNGPIMANALAAIGFGVTYIGNLGHPTIHPVFEELARRAEVISIAEAAHTDALEFADGKLMLGKMTPLNDVNWENLVRVVGREDLLRLIGQARLVGMVNWTMLPHMSRIWQRMQEEIFPSLPREGRKLFVDMADPEKRTVDDIAEAMELLTKFQAQVDVILGLNLKESQRVAEVIGVPHGGGGGTEAAAGALRRKLGISCVVIHPRRGAAAATEQESAAFDGPFVQHPKISTGAGDHFNAGFCLGRVMGFGLEESLCTGVATSGYYVRNAASPTAEQLVDFIADLPPAEK